jgi:hypothetical protein
LLFFFPFNCPQEAPAHYLPHPDENPKKFHRTTKAAFIRLFSDEPQKTSIKPLLFPAQSRRSTRPPIAASVMFFAEEGKKPAFSRNFPRPTPTKTRRRPRPNQMAYIFSPVNLVARLLFFGAKNMSKSFLFLIETFFLRSF